MKMKFLFESIHRVNIYFRKIGIRESVIRPQQFIKLSQSISLKNLTARENYLFIGYELFLVMNTDTCMNTI